MYTNKCQDSEVRQLPDMLRLRNRICGENLKNQIQLVLKNNIRDVQGEKIRQVASTFLNIDTGKVKTGKIFNVMYDLDKKENEQFANLGLKDEIIHDV